MAVVAKTMAMTRMVRTSLIRGDPECGRNVPITQEAAPPQYCLHPKAWARFGSSSF
jgi:hypothetical protein